MPEFILVCEGNVIKALQVCFMCEFDQWWGWYSTTETNSPSVYLGGPIQLQLILG